MHDGEWENRRCFIIGGGPSLKGFDFGRLADEFTIGINKAAMSFLPTVFFSLDNSFIRDCEDGLVKDAEENVFDLGSLDCVKVWMRNIPGVKFDCQPYTVDRSEYEEFYYTLDRPFCWTRNSGFGALQLAVILRASPIYLLGFDMRGNEDGKQAWWHSPHRIVRSDKCYKRYAREFERHAPNFQRYSEVVNLNPNSALRCFPFGDVDKVLP